MIRLYHWQTGEFDFFFVSHLFIFHTFLLIAKNSSWSSPTAPYIFRKRSDSGCWLKRKCFIFTMSTTSATGLPHRTFNVLRYYSTPCFLRAFIKTESWILSKAFSPSFNMITDYCQLLCLYIILCLSCHICWTIFNLL